MRCPKQLLKSAADQADTSFQLHGRAHQGQPAPLLGAETAHPADDRIRRGAGTRTCERFGDNAITRLGVFLAGTRAGEAGCRIQRLPTQHATASA
jgi:hypothetical protein